MMLAIGMLVDNAVVITESVFRHRQLDPNDPRGATLRGVREVGVATLAGTLATIIVFVPLVFGSPSEITILMKHVAIPIVIAMIASLLVAQTIIPMLSARIAAPPTIAERLARRRLQDRYAAALHWVLEHPRKTGTGAARHPRLAGRAVRHQGAQGRPVPAGRRPRPVPRLSHQGHASARAGRAGREPHGGVPDGQPRALRHPERLLALRHDRARKRCCN